VPENVCPVFLFQLHSPLKPLPAYRFHTFSTEVLHQHQVVDRGVHPGIQNRAAVRRGPEEVVHVAEVIIGHFISSATESFERPAEARSLLGNETSLNLPLCNILSRQQIRAK
jgi:hypothetical protein